MNDIDTTLVWVIGLIVVGTLGATLSPQAWGSVAAIAALGSIVYWLTRRHHHG